MYARLHFHLWKNSNRDTFRDNAVDTFRDNTVDTLGIRDKCAHNYRDKG